jgi:maleate isomerase
LTTTTDLLVNRHHLPFQLDGGVAPRAAIGLIVLATDHTIEREWRDIFSRIDGVGVFHSRIWNEPEINPETLARMEQDLAACTRVLRPGERIDVVGYGCTSASIVIGPENVARRVNAERPGVPVTNPITAATTALKAMGVERIALLTPYIDEVNLWMRGHIEKEGLGVPVMGSFNHSNDNEVARISEATIEEALVTLASNDAVDGAFVACTSLRVCGIIEKAEQRLGKPVTSSNLALAWHCLRLAGITDELDGLGRLFRTQLLAG